MHESREEADASDHPGADVRHLPARVEPPGEDALEPVGGRTLAPPRESALPAPLAAAAGGFLAGLATWVLVRALRPRGRGLALRRSRRERTLAITGSRSFLVDVHLLKR